MGKIFEKDGELREEHDFFGFVYSSPAGELHENLDGTRETRNSFGENYTIGRQPENPFDCITAPLGVPRDRPVSTSSGETGSMQYNKWRGRYEYSQHAGQPAPAAKSYDAGSGTRRGASNRTPSARAEILPELQPFPFFSLAFATVAGYIGIEWLSRILYSNAADAFSMRNDNGMAAFCAENAGNYTRAYEHYLRAGDVEKAFKSGEKVWGAEGAIESLRYRSLAKKKDVAELAKRHGLIDLAIDIYSSDNTNTFSIEKAAELALGRGDVKKAIGIYTRENTNRRYPDGHFKAARIAESHGMYEEAIAVYEKILAYRKNPSVLADTGGNLNLLLAADSAEKHINELRNKSKS